MKAKDFKKFLPNFIPAVVVLVILGGFVVYGFIKISRLNEDIAFLNTELASTTEALSQNLANLRAETVGISNTLTSTQQNIDAVKTQVGGVEETVGSISGTVGDLQKLSKTDPELLQKYSKVYFLNENYVPTRLADIQNKNKYYENRDLEILFEVKPHLEEMLAGALNDGVEIYVLSAYRSFEEQQQLKNQYSVVYGEGTANQFSADQGYSEHQLGTTVDLITTGIGGTLDGFDTTKAYQWLLTNAYKYGFALSYPKNNSYYIFEPWHWRFVGLELSSYLHENNLHFYNLDQREIDEYLLNIFD